MDLNSWSRGLYFYIAGASQVELYRNANGVDAEKAVRYTPPLKIFRCDDSYDPDTCDMICTI